ncbi:hypothetical protein SDC9_80244 [bioreactor metagenome]|uniref:Uncharacterized protein n=1 Tax=bioreactor metagenome TaxID=1076179 RepID=A0A644YZ82_9ZZZZ
MYKIIFMYTDGTKLSFENLKSIQYPASSWKNVSGDELLTHFFPLEADYHLQLENKGCMVSHKDLLVIEITKMS